MRRKTQKIRRLQLRRGSVSRLDLMELDRAAGGREIAEPGADAGRAQAVAARDDSPPPNLGPLVYT